MRYPVAKADWIFAPVALIAVVHLINGVSVLLAPHSAGVSGLAGLNLGIADPVLMAFLLIVAGVMALAGRFGSFMAQDMRFALIVPQQIILMVQLAGVAVAVYLGQYPDGYNPHEDWWISAVFIFSDQAALVVMCLSHSLEMVMSRSIMGRIGYWMTEIKKAEAERDQAERALLLMQDTKFWMTTSWDKGTSG